jgi:SAM-dependent methyltransferase
MWGVMTTADSVDSSGNYDPIFIPQLAEIEDRHFWFRTRKQVIGSLIAQITVGLPPGYRVLEVGCGTGSVLSTLADVCRGGVVIGVDLLTEALVYARRRSPGLLVQGDVHALPFRREMSVIGLFDVLEHLPDDQRALSDLGDLLVPDGALVLTVPAHKSLWSYFDEAARHYRRYEPAELRDKLHRAGYHVEYLTHYMAVMLPLAWAWRRLTALVDRRQSGKAERTRELTLRELRVLPVLNEFLRLLLAQEARLVARRKILPIGASLVAICRKRHEHQASG